MSQLFPQLSTGQVTSLPVQRAPFFTTSVNRSDDGTELRYAETAQELGSWQIALNNLPDADAATLIAFFNANLRYGRFIFLDPFQNLAKYSEDFTQASVWVPDSLVTVTGGVVDPYGTSNAQTVSSSAVGNKAIKQTVQFGPASQTISPFPNMWLTFSIWLKTSGSPTSVRVFVGEPNSPFQTSSKTFVTTGAWTRVSTSFNFATSSNATMFCGIGLTGAVSVNVFGAQLMYLPGMGDYTKTTTVTGVRPVCRFDSDALQVTGTTFGGTKITVPVVELVA